MEHKVRVIVNPFSARGKTGHRWTAIKDIITRYFKEFKYELTEKPAQATEIARDSLREGFDLIIGVGGDGTLNEITNGFFDAETRSAINESASMGVIPSGTGSDFIRFLKIPRDFDQSVQLIKESSCKTIDVGKITYLKKNGENGVSRYFINVADFGLGAEVIRTLAAVPAIKRGPFVYYKGLLSTLRNYSSRPVRITLDNQKTIENQFLIGAVANGRIFGGGMIIAPSAEPDDGLLDLVLVEDMKTLEVVRNSRLLYSGKIHSHPKVQVHKVKTLLVETPADVGIEYDGELGAQLPARFEVVPACIRLRA